MREAAVEGRVLAVPLFCVVRAARIIDSLAYRREFTDFEVAHICPRAPEVGRSRGYQHVEDVTAGYAGRARHSAPPEWYQSCSFTFGASASMAVRAGMNGASGIAEHPEAGVRRCEQ